ncbi:NAD-dependent epimerase/dehydratase family protein [bacterium]|jgi:GDP-L-fucose synthase|nr:NAD-dependent epimerase/dehydratase family protein [bacterium]
MKVLVTGGSGLVGSAIKEIRPDWIYIGSTEFGSLSREENVQKMYETVGPVDAVIHLAANVGGLFKNMNKRAEMYEDNILMNTHVLSYAAKHKIPRVLTMLSTCIFPDGLKELCPSDLHTGPPHHSNEGYAYAKRVCEVHSRIIRETTNTWVTCLIPTNIYGPNDNFSIENGHVIPALIHKASLAKKNDEPLKIIGTGQAKRQFIHSRDIARIIVWAVELDENPPPEIVCSCGEEVSISEVAHIIVNATRCKGIEYVDGPDGQMSKKAIPGPGNFPTPVISLEDGIRETVEWFQNGTTRT